MDLFRDYISLPQADPDSFDLNTNYDLFAEYEQDFAETYRKLSYDLKHMYEDKKEINIFSREIDRFEENLKACELAISSMEQEYINFPPSKKTQVSSKLKQCKADFKNLQNQWNQFKLFINSKDESGSEDEDNFSSDIKKNNSKLESETLLTRSQAAIERSIQIAAESESIGEESLSNLAQQKEVLSHSLVNTILLSRRVGEARRILNRMDCNETKMWLCYWFIVVILAVIALLILVFGIFLPLKNHCTGSWWSFIWCLIKFFSPI